MRLALYGILAGIIAFLLPGCATQPAPVVQEIRVPVAVPCKTQQIGQPAFAVEALPIGSGVWDQMRALRAERQQRIGYEAELEAAVKACQ